LQPVVYLRDRRDFPLPGDISADVSWFSPETFGIYIGSTVHEVAQVVAAGHAISPDAENAAVISKMLRVMMLAPFLILLAARVKQLSGANSDEKANHYSVVCHLVHRRCHL